MKSLNLKFDELELNKLNLNIQSTAKKILQVYADSHDDLNCERDLDFISINPINGDDLIRIMSKIVPHYNYFEGQKSCEQLVKMFGRDAAYFVAREGSVCIYVKPSRKLTWLNRQKLDCDEFSYDCDENKFRVWWD